MLFLEKNLSGDGGIEAPSKAIIRKCLQAYSLRLPPAGGGGKDKFRSRGLTAATKPIWPPRS